MWFMWICLVLIIAIEIAVFCFKSVARKVPTNYILCGVFTFCFSWIVSTVCSSYGYDLDGNPDTEGQTTVLIAAVMTLGITVALTIYAFTTKTDFTMMGGFLFCLFVGLLLFGLFAWLFQS